ncbi:helix-turn-helix domain-containing protein [Rhodocyclus tenuis]|uniref:helix-turn-helix domain-containing protein n=1 Tax=Rhodocyclus tenuis TaxID=1066 RepID=UPI0030B9152E|nr:hypothetical protein [Rhodocyclus tenuis]
MIHCFACAGAPPVKRLHARSCIMVQRQHIEKTFCTTREAAQMLGVSLRTAQLWTESGLLDAWKTAGGHRRISRHSINSLLSKTAFPPLPGTFSSALQGRVAERGDPLNILVVEEDSELRQLYQVNLEGWSMRPEVCVAANVYEGLILMGITRPDLLVADLRLPAQAGFHMLRAVREMPELAGLSIVAVSGLSSDEITALGGLPDGISVLPKPLRFGQLLDIAERVVASRRAVNRSAW